LKELPDPLGAFDAARRRFRTLSEDPDGHPAPPDQPDLARRDGGAGIADEVIQTAETGAATFPVRVDGDFGSGGMLLLPQQPGKLYLAPSPARRG